MCTWCIAFYYLIINQCISCTLDLISFVRFVIYLFIYYKTMNAIYPNFLIRFVCLLLFYILLVYPGFISGLISSFYLFIYYKMVYFIYPGFISDLFSFVRTYVLYFCSVNKMK